MTTHEFNKNGLILAVVFNGEKNTASYTDALLNVRRSLPVFKTPQQAIYSAINSIENERLVSREKREEAKNFLQRLIRG